MSVFLYVGAYAFISIIFNYRITTFITILMAICFTLVVVDLPLLRVAVEGSDNPVSLEKPCQASLPPDQQGRHSRETTRGPVCCLRYIGVCS